MRQSHKIDLSGEYRSTVYSAARRLLAAGADPADIVETWRNGVLSMSGAVGECAGLMVLETASGNPSLQLSAWKALPASGSVTRTAKSAFPAQCTSQPAEATQHG